MDSTMSLVIARVELKSMSWLSFSAPLRDDPMGKEEPKAYEKRIWRKRFHATEEGHLYIPPLCFKYGLDAAASLDGTKIANKGNSTYAKRFKSGIIVQDAAMLFHDAKRKKPWTRDELKSEEVFSSPKGAGGTTRVWKTFPYIESWYAQLDVHILDEVITQTIFETVFALSGVQNGVGRWRPQSGGLKGRFSVLSVDWEQIAEAAA